METNSSEDPPRVVYLLILLGILLLVITILSEVGCAVTIKVGQSPSLSTIEGQINGSVDSSTSATLRSNSSPILKWD